MKFKCLFAIALLIPCLVHAAMFNPVGVTKLSLQPVRPNLSPRLSDATLNLLQGKLIAQYDALAVIAVPNGEAATSSLKAEQLGYRVEELSDLIQTPGGTPIDPQQGSISPFNYGPEKGMYLIQYVAPAKPEWQRIVRDAGVEVVEELPERAIVAVATPQRVELIKSFSFLQFIGVYAPEHKFRPVTISADDEYWIQFVRAAESNPAIEAARESVGGFIYEVSYGNKLNARAKLTPSLAQQFLALPFVLGIEKYVPLMPSDERQSLSITGSSVPSGDYLNYLAARGITQDGLTQSGIVIDVADTGLDLGCETNPFAHVDIKGHDVSFKGVAPLYDSPGFEEAADQVGHGTIVAGIIGARNISNHWESDAYGSFRYGVGVAPGVLLGATKIRGFGHELPQGSVTDWATKAVNMLCNSWNNRCSFTSPCPATAQNHSHNEYNDSATQAGKYNLTAQQYDSAVRDADGNSGNGNQQIALTVSAGNYKGDSPTSTDTTTKVLSPATAKNVITVGAVESRRAAGIFSICETSAEAGGENPTLRNKADGFNVVSYVSRRGTEDSRFKPELMFPATLALGPESDTAQEYCAQSGSVGTGTTYQGGSGTSFAAPGAAGAIALLRYKRGHQSPAMYKAMLVSESRSLTNALDRLETHLTGSPKYVPRWPDVTQGFGAVKLDRVIDSNYTATWGYDQQTVLTQGQQFSRTITVSNPNEPVRITVAWTDAPAAAGAVSALKNRLQSEVSFPSGRLLLGNEVDSSGYSNYVSCGRPTCLRGDFNNNVHVFNLSPAEFTDPSNRTFTFKVTTPALNGVGVPPSGVNNQDFAVFMTNVASVQ